MLSVSLNVRSVDSAFNEGLRWHLAPFKRPTPDPEHARIRVYVPDEDGWADAGAYTYFRNSFPLASYGRVDSLVEFAVWDIHNFVPQRTGDFLLLHAGAVSSPQGALLLPGAPDTGKSSLVAALIQEGFSYLSDELGVLDPVTLRAYPFPKHIALDEASLTFSPSLEERTKERRMHYAGAIKVFVRPEDLGASVADPTRVRSLVFLADDREGPPRLEPVSRATAVELMVAQSLNFFRYEDRGVILLSRIAQDVHAFRLVGGSVLERAAMLVNRFL